jgi:hypothetical protein
MNIYSFHIKAQGAANSCKFCGRCQCCTEYPTYLKEDASFRVGIYVIRMKNKQKLQRTALSTEH